MATISYQSPQPLPLRLGYDDAHAFSAYNQCRDVERQIIDIDPKHWRLINIRIVGYLLQYPPSPVAITCLAREIAHCRRLASDETFDHAAARDPETVEQIEKCEDCTSLDGRCTGCIALTKGKPLYKLLSNLGRLYRDYLLRSFRRAKGRTPVPSDHPSRKGSFSEVRDRISNTLEVVPANHQTAKHEALIRDSFRCLVTNKLDHNEAVRRAIRTAQTSGQFSIPEKTEYTECAHIFSQGTNTNLKDENKKYLASASWAVIERFGFQEIMGELNAEKVHSLTNILTLSPRVHTAFDNLTLYFEETNLPNHYRVAGVPVSPQDIIEGCPDFVTFTTPDPGRYPLPLPKYLRIHAACCKVGHMSGASGAFELEDIDDLDPSEPVFAEALNARLLLLTRESQGSRRTEVA